MNGMMALMPMLNMNKSTSGNGSNVAAKGNDKEGAFIELLTLIMGGTQAENEDVLNEELIDTLGLDEELVTLLLNSSLEELVSSLEEPLKMLSELIEELPLEEGFLSEDLLDLEQTEKLLETLPDEWSKEIKTLIENNTSLEGLLEEFKTSGNPVEMLTMMIALSDDRVDDLRTSQVYQQVLQLYFPKFNQEEKNQSVRQTLSQLTTFLTNGERTSSTENQFVAQRQAFNTNRFAELAYMNQFASENSQSKKSSQVLPSSMMLNTTNSEMARFQTMVMPSGESAPERPSQEQFVRQFQNLLSKSSFQQLANGSQQLSLKLHPASLGRMDITIQQVNGVMMASIMTTTKVARDLMDGQLSQLRNAFQSQNIQIDKIEVTQQQTQHQLLKDSNNQEAKDHHEGQHKEVSDNEEETEEQDFAEFLAETINIEA